MGRGFEPHTSPQKYKGLSVSDPLGPFCFVFLVKTFTTTESSNGTGDRPNLAVCSWTMFGQLFIGISLAVC